MVLKKIGLYSAYDVKRYGIYNDGIVIIEKYNDYMGELMMVFEKTQNITILTRFFDEMAVIVLQW